MTWSFCICVVDTELMIINDIYSMSYKYFSTVNIKIEVKALLMIAGIKKIYIYFKLACLLTSTYPAMNCR